MNQLYPKEEQIMNEDRKSDRPSTYDYKRPAARKELRAD